MSENTDTLQQGNNLPRTRLTPAQKQKAYRERLKAKKAEVVPSPVPDPISTPTVTQAVTKGEGRGILRGEPSPAPAHATPDKRPSYFDLLPIEPAPQEVFDRCALRLARGDDWPDIARDEGKGPRELWQMCGKYANGDPLDAGKRWQAAQNAEVDLHRRDTALVHSQALRAGIDGVKRKVRTKAVKGKDGKPIADLTETETTEEFGLDPALLRIALETGDPATHGRQAGRSEVKVQTAIQIVMQPGDEGIT